MKRQPMTGRKRKAAVWLALLLIFMQLLPLYGTAEGEAAPAGIAPRNGVADGTLAGGEIRQTSFPAFDGNIQWLMQQIYNAWLPAGSSVRPGTQEMYPNSGVVGISWLSGTSANGQIPAGETNIRIDHIWKDAEGHPIYCFDYATNAEGARSDKNLEDLPAGYTDTARLVETWRMASALSADDFRLVRTFATPDFHSQKFGFTIPGSYITAQLAAASADTLQSLVQYLVWVRMHRAQIDDRYMLDLYTAGGWVTGKDGVSYYAEPTFIHELFPVTELLDIDGLIGVGLANADPKMRIKNVSSGDGYPSDLNHPGQLGGQILIRAETSGEVKLVKTSARPDITEGNPFYDLTGTAYRLYTAQACTEAVKDVNGAEVVLTLPANGGETNTARVEAGTYWAKEVTAGRGYALNGTPISVTVKAGETAVIQAADEPNLDPVGIVLSKQDAGTGREAERVVR